MSIHECFVKMAQYNFEVMDMFCTPFKANTTAAHTDPTVDLSKNGAVGTYLAKKCPHGYGAMVV